MPSSSIKPPITSHPCFNEQAHFRFGRIHLPVAPACNLQCAYCSRDYDCPNESRPGVTSSIITPQEAVLRVRVALKNDNRIRVVGIAGPGDPLANEETFETLALIHKEFPQLTLCLSTNGLLLNDKLANLVGCGLSALTVTVNTLDVFNANTIYSVVNYKGNIYTGEKGGSILLNAQRDGVRNAVKAGLTVKINTVFIPDVNGGEVENIAHWAALCGASIMNLTPLIPQGSFMNKAQVDLHELKQLREKASRYIPQFSLCRQCRADACGVPGDAKTISYKQL